MIAYQAPMLPNIDYEKAFDEDGTFFSLVDLEYSTLENCREFLELLTQALKEENLMQTPELLIAHLCAYLGTVVTLHTVHDAEKLEPSIIELIKHQAHAAYVHFNQHPINSTVTNDELKKANAEKLREKSPGSIIAQTIRLGRVVMNILEELSYHRKTNFKGLHLPKQTEMFCSQDMLIKLMLLVGAKKCAELKKQLDGLSEHYVINQLAIQIGWLMGYFSHLEKKSPDKTDYLDYGLPVIQLYREHVYRMMHAYAQHTQEEIEQSEAEELLSNIHQLSEKAHTQQTLAVTDFQKQVVMVQAGSEKILIELLNRGLEVKIILMSLFYFWFTLEAPLHSSYPELIENENPFSHMEPIITLVKETILSLPKPELTPEINALNEQMQRLKNHLPHPETLDNVPQAKVKQQTEQVNKAIHTLTCDYLKQNIPIEAITNVLFSQWLRFSVFFGVSESDWQKMDYYLPDLLKAVRKYLSTIFNGESVP